MPERDELDRLIDSALARYGEPRSGLEQRMLARVDDEVARRHGFFRKWQAWALVGAAAAAILLLVFVQRPAHREASISSATLTSPNREQAEGRSPSTVPEVHNQVRHLANTSKTTHPGARKSKPTESTPAAKPRLDVFPAPQPLSAEERALVEIATEPSDVGRENLIASQRALDAPLQISAIEIPPITSPDAGKK
jgi:hypothetical protein